MRIRFENIRYLLTAIGLTPGDSSTVHIYTQIIHRTTQLTNLVGRLSGNRIQSGQTNWKMCVPCSVFASFTLAFALQLRKRHGKTSVSSKNCLVYVTLTEKYQDNSEGKPVVAYFKILSPPLTEEN